MPFISEWGVITTSTILANFLSYPFIGTCISLRRFYIARTFSASWQCWKGPIIQRCTHYIDVIMSTVTSQITSFSIVCSAVCSDANQRKHQSSVSLAFVRGIHRSPVNSPHKGPVPRKMFPFDDIIMYYIWYITPKHNLLWLKWNIFATVLILRAIWQKLALKIQTSFFKITYTQSVLPHHINVMSWHA